MIKLLQLSKWLFIKSIGRIPKEKRKEILKGLEELTKQAAKAYIEYELNKRADKMRRR